MNLLPFEMFGRDEAGIFAGLIRKAGAQSKELAEDYAGPAPEGIETGNLQDRVTALLSTYQESVASALRLAPTEDNQKSLHEILDFMVDHFVAQQAYETGSFTHLKQEIPKLVLQTPQKLPENIRFPDDVLEGYAEYLTKVRFALYKGSRNSNGANDIRREMTEAAGNSEAALRGVLAGYPAATPEPASYGFMADGLNNDR